MKLSTITPIHLLNAAKTLLLALPALLMCRRRSKVWIITERRDQARDNGYIFFRYMRKKHPEQRVYYIIDKTANDARKTEKYGHVIPFDSLRHYLLYNLAQVHISAHVGGCTPSRNPFAKRMKRLLKIKDVFIPHGVSYGISEFCLAKYAKIDLFITSGKPEYKNVLTHYGYTKEQVVCTGFPRLDEWHHIHVNPRQIVLMPTWRMYLAQNPDTKFQKTAYYRAYQDFINSKALSTFLIENRLKLVFYLHHEMRKYVNFFHTECPNIEMVYRDETCDIQELLKESALLITDFSSVQFDFAYMEKPVLYYQFDREEFWRKQYRQSGFDMDKDGFGPVAYDLDTLLDLLRQAYKDGLRLKDEYKRRMMAFYVFRDKHNCDRVYEEIIKHFE